MAALNWTMLDPNRKPVPLPGETDVLTIDDGVEVTLLIPSSNSGGEMKTMKENGKLWLTDQRLIFLTKSTSSNPAFESLSALLSSILSTQFLQPYFGANHLVMELKPAPEGGLVTNTKAEVRFKDKGLYEFVNVLEKTRERAVYRMREKMMGGGEDLPVYSTGDSTPSTSQDPPSTAGLGPPPPTPTDLPPGYNA